MAVAVASALKVAEVLAPAEAHAARSGGRISSSGFGARRSFAATPRMGAPAHRQPTVVNNYRSTHVAAPTLASPFSPFGGFGGFGFVRPVAVLPFPALGVLLQMLLAWLMLSIVLGVVRAAITASQRRRAAKRQWRSDSEDWDSL